ncbi:MAG TPA: TVP38/TMEM64 family protein [Candidatus Binataceae bacterium]|nr:TVP38/TMEM64 family protein [Candidatus Binataceae bacterium]
MTEQSNSNPRGGRAWLWLAAITIALVAVIVLGRRFGGELSILLDRIRTLGPAAPIAFIAIYVAACVLFIPGSILTIGAGVLFGVVWGSIYVSIAATAGASAAFILGRYFLRATVARRIEGNRSFKTIDEAVAREGWKIVLLTRLSPIFPFNLLNYAFGLTRVSFAEYVFASWAGMIPGTVMYVYIGSLSGDLARAASGNHPRPAAGWILNVIGLAATIAVAVYATRIGSRALKERT